MRAELKRAADLVAFQRREALSRKRLSGDPRNPFRPRYGAELTFAAASQEAETLGYGFEFFGDITEIARIRNARCCYIGTVNTSKEG